MDLTDFSMDAFRELLDHAAIRETDVSQWSVGMHVHHACRASTGIAKALERSEPPVPPLEENERRDELLSTGRIPRGAAEAPEIALPQEGIAGDDLAEQIARCEEALARALALPTDRWFRHFALGVLDRDSSLRFIEVHHRHHLGIIRDILKKHRS